jgi:hypothetical protein
MLLLHLLLALLATRCLDQSARTALKPRVPLDSGVLVALL